MSGAVHRGGRDYVPFHPQTGNLQIQRPAPAGHAAQAAIAAAQQVPAAQMPPAQPLPLPAAPPLHGAPNAQQQAAPAQQRPAAPPPHGAHNAQQPAAQAPAPQPGLGARLNQWWENSTAQRRSILLDYTPPTLKKADQTQTSSSCVDELENTNRLRTSLLDRMQHLLQILQASELRDIKKDLRTHYQYNLAIQELAKEYIKRFLDKPNDPLPADAKIINKRFKDAADKFNQLNVLQKEVLDLLVSKVDIPIERLRYQRAENPKPNTLALKFVKDHFLFTSGLFASGAAICRPDLFSFLPTPENVTRVAIPAIYFVGGILFGGPKQAIKDLGHATVENLKSLAQAYISNGLVMGTVGALTAGAVGTIYNVPYSKEIAETIFVANSILCVGQFACDNASTIAGDTAFGIQQTAVKLNDFIHHYVRNAWKSYGIGVSLATRIFTNSWGWAGGVYALHALASGIVNLSEMDS